MTRGVGTEPPVKGAGPHPWARRIQFLVVALACWFAVLASFLWAILETERVAVRFVDTAIPWVNQVIPGQVRFSAFSGTLGHRLVLEDVEVLDAEGQPCLRAKRLEVDWNVWDLTNLSVDVSRVLVVAPDVLVGFREDGSLNLTSAFVAPAAPESAQAEPPDASLWSVVVRSVQVQDGAVRVHLPATEADPEGMSLYGDRIQVEASYALQGGHHDIQLESLSVEPRKPLALSPVRLEGGVRLEEMDLVTEGISVRWRDNKASIVGRIEDLHTPRLDLRLEAESLHLRDLRAFAPDLPLQGSLALSMDAKGPLTQLNLGAEIRTEGGGVVEIQEGLIALGADELKHQFQLSAVDLTLSEVSEGLDAVPEKLSFQLGWKGSGRSPENLQGDVLASVGPFAYRGLEPIAAEAQAHWEARRLRVDSARLSLAGGHVLLAGDVSSLEQSFAGTLDASRIDLNEFSTLVGGVLGGTANVQAAFRGGWAAEAPTSLHVKGSVGVDRLRLPGILAASARSDVDLDLDLIAGDLPRPVGQVMVELLKPQLAGGTAVDRVSLDGQLTGSAAQCSASVSRSSGLLARLQAGVDWSSHPTVVVQGERLELLAGEQLMQTTAPFTVRVRQGALELNDLAVDFHPGSLSAELSYDPSRPYIRSLVRLSDVDLRQLVELQRALLGADTAGGMAGASLLAALSGQINQARLKIDGSLASPRIELSSQMRELKIGARGPLGLEVDLVSDEGAVGGQLGVEGLLALKVDRLPLTVRLDGRGLPVVLAEDEDWQLTLDVGEAEVAAFEPLVGRKLPGTVAGGAIRGRVTVAGPTSSLQVRGDLGLSELSVSDHRVQGQLALLLEDDQLSLDGSRVKTAATGRILEFEGRAAAPIGEFLLGRLGPRSRRSNEPVPLLNGLELGVKVRKLPMSLLHPIVPASSPITGALQGSLSLTGELADPNLDLKVRLLGGRVGREALKRTEFSARVEGGKLSSAFEMDPKIGGALRVTTASSFPLHLGRLPDRDSLLGVEDLQVAVDGQGFPLAMVAAFIPGSTDTEGVVQLQGAVTGSLGAPQPSLALSLNSGRLCHELTSICYEDVTLESKLVGNRAELKGLSLTTVPQVRNPLDLLRRASGVGDKSRLSLGGFVLLNGLSPRWTELDLRLERAWASYSEQIQVQVDGDLRLTGYSPSLRLTGDLDLPTVRLDLGRADTRREVQPLELPGNLSVHRMDSQPGPGEWEQVEQAKPQQAGFLERLRQASEMDVGIHLGNNVQVALAVGIAGQRSRAVQALNLMGSIEPELKLGGDISLRWQGGEPTVVGRLSMERGSSLRVLTRSFTMDDESFVEFVGRIPDSQLSLRATHSSRYGPVSVRVSERMASPTLRFESDVFEDQADILSILLTGKPMSELSTAEGSQALSGMAGTLAGFGTKAFGKYTPLDSLDVDVGDDISTGSAEAGKALGPRVFLITRFRWGAEEGENRVEGQLEVQITPRLYLETVIGDRLQGAAELVWKKQF